MLRAESLLADGRPDGTHTTVRPTSPARTVSVSVGGTAAVETGEHAAVATVDSIHGQEATSALHGPLLQTSGINDDIGLPLREATFVQSQVQTFLGIVAEADHGYSQGTRDGVPGGVETPCDHRATSLLDLQIYRDEGGKKYFYGVHHIDETAMSDELCERFF